MQTKKLLAIAGATVFTTSKFAAACLSDGAGGPCTCIGQTLQQLSVSSGSSIGFGLAGGLAGGPAPTPVSIQNFTFTPDNILIKPNTTVRWTNLDPAFHTSTDNPVWDSGALGQFQTFDFAFGAANAGHEYDYICAIHPFMTGAVRVTRFGDANVDGVVNVNDFAILATHFGQQTGGTWETGDFNADGIINVNDFTLLASNFGGTIQPGGTINLTFGNSVPEPASAALLLGALLPLRRRRAH